MIPARLPAGRISLGRFSRNRDADFLPAVIEIIESPPSPIGRGMLWSIILLVAIAVAWAWFGRVDVIASARGVVLPSGRVKLVQPLQPGTVTAIHVRDGATVRAGDLLVELDPTAAQADIAAHSRAAMISAIEVARLRALLAALSSDTPSDPKFVPPADADPILVAEARSYLDYQIRVLRARLSGLTEQAERARGSLAETQAEVARLEQTLPLAGQVSEARDLLAGRGLGSRLEALQERQRYIGQRQELVAARARADQAANQIAALTAQRAEALADAGREAGAQLAQAQARLAAETEELAKARQRLRETRLYAPSDGVVEGLAVHTVGGVVTAAQQLMSIVPMNEVLEIEAKLPDRDIAFVEVGQQAVIKLDAYPFTRYGTLSGRVTGVSRDAVRDEKLGLLYSVRVMLDGAAPGPMPRSGMGANVEVWTGRRRVAEYLLSPLEQRTKEAFRER
jgi:hemolysin D